MQNTAGKNTTMVKFMINAMFSDGQRIEAEVTAENRSHAYRLFLDIPQIKEFLKKRTVEQYSISEVDDEVETIEDDGRFKLLPSPDGNGKYVVLDFKYMLACTFMQGDFKATAQVTPLDKGLFDDQIPFNHSRALAGFIEYITVFYPQLL